MSTLSALPAGFDPGGHHVAGPHGPERLALPLHLQPAAAALFDDLPAPLPDQAVDGAVADLHRGRSQLAAAVPAGTELVVDAYRVRLAAACPASLHRGDAPFRWTPATAARHLGLRALALHLCGDRPRSVEQAVAVVLAGSRPDADRTPGPWLAQLDPSARAVAQAQAQRWAEQALSWLPLRLVDRRALRFLDDDWWPAPERRLPGGARRSGGRTVVVHGRRDLTVDVGGRHVAVTVAGGAAGGPGAAGADALLALATLLADRRSRLVRVVRVHPASGEVVAVDVTPDLARQGVAAVLATATGLAAVAAGDEVRARPGPGCTWCPRLPSCAAGTAFGQRPERRSMGLPLSGPPAATRAPDGGGPALSG